MGVIALKLLLSAGVGYLPNQIHYFLAGIASYYLFFLADKKYAVEGFRHDALMVSFTAILIVSAPSPWPWVIWLWAFDLILMQKVGATSTLTRLTSRVLAWRPFLFLGKISYSIYLIHVPILYVVFHVLVHMNPRLMGWEFFAAALPLTLGLTVAFSFITYLLVERPGIQVGNIVARKRTVYGQ